MSVTLCAGLVPGFPGFPIYDNNLDSISGFRDTTFSRECYHGAFTGISGIIFPSAEAGGFLPPGKKVMAKIATRHKDAIFSLMSLNDFDT